MAIYQALYPNSYVKSTKAMANASNRFTTDAGDLQDDKSRLFPFWNNSGKDFWDPSGI